MTNITLSVMWPLSFLAVGTFVKGYITIDQLDGKSIPVYKALLLLLILSGVLNSGCEIVGVIRHLHNALHRDFWCYICAWWIHTYIFTTAAINRHCMILA